MKNYPALKCYTSENQYNALKIVRDTKNIVTILKDGHASKTLGSLVRSGWIQEREYADKKVMRMGWFLTKEGENAIQVYEADQEVKRLIKDDQAKKVEQFKKKYPEYYAVEVALTKLIDEKAKLERKRTEMKYELRSYISHLCPGETNRLVEMLNAKIEMDKMTGVKNEN